MRLNILRDDSVWAAHWKPVDEVTHGYLPLSSRRGGNNDIVA